MTPNLIADKIELTKLANRLLMNYDANQWYQLQAEVVTKTWPISHPNWTVSKKHNPKNGKIGGYKKVNYCPDFHNEGIFLKNFAPFSDQGLEMPLSL